MDTYLIYIICSGYTQLSANSTMATMTIHLFPPQRSNVLRQESYVFIEDANDPNQI